MSLYLPTFSVFTRTIGLFSIVSEVRWIRDIDEKVLLGFLLRYNLDIRKSNFLLSGRENWIPSERIHRTILVDHQQIHRNHASTLKSLILLRLFVSALRCSSQGQITSDDFFSYYYHLHSISSDVRELKYFSLKINWWFSAELIRNNPTCGMKYSRSNLMFLLCGITAAFSMSIISNFPVSDALNFSWISLERISFLAY